MQVAALHERADLAIRDVALEHPEAAVRVDVFDPLSPSTLSARSIARATVSAVSISVDLISTTPRPKPISGADRGNRKLVAGRCAVSITI